MHKVGVEMAAAGTFNGLRGIIFTKQQSLHFAQLESAEDTPQTGDAAAFAASLVDGFADCLAAAFVLGVGEDSFGFGADFFAADVGDLGGKTAEQPLRDVGMQLSLKLRPMRILAAENPLLKHAFV